MLFLWLPFRTLHNEEACELSRLPNAVRIVKSRRFLWSGYVDRARSEFRILMSNKKHTFQRLRRRWIGVGKDQDHGLGISHA
jgi:hypothetical protein